MSVNSERRRAACEVARRLRLAAPPVRVRTAFLASLSARASSRALRASVCSNSAAKCSGALPACGGSARHLYQRSLNSWQSRWG